MINIFKLSSPIDSKTKKNQEFKQKLCRLLPLSNEGLISCLFILAIAPSVKAATTPLNFNSIPVLINPTNTGTNISATGATSTYRVGNVYRFANVFTGIDALVTIKAVSGNARLKTLDDNTSFGNRLQPTIVSTTANSQSHIRFDIQLVSSGTTFAATATNVYFSAQDVDGNGAANSIREFVEIVGAQTSYVANPTLLQPMSVLPVPGGVAYQQTNSTNVQSGIGTDDRYEFYSFLGANISSFSVVGGNIIGNTACTDASCERQNSWSFNVADVQKLDFSDAPISYGDAYHPVPSAPTVFFGTNVTGDDGPNYSNTDIDDGITNFPTITTASSSYGVTASCKNNGAVVAGWIDFNRNGTFEATERASGICNGTSVTLNWTGISGLTAGNTYGRFRIATNSAEVSNATGAASNGEVEDYSIAIAALDYSDTPANGGSAPNGSGTNGYGNASHIIVSGTRLGTNIDAETVAQNSANADGDDNNGTDDEDGITIPTLTLEQTATITANVAGTGGYLQGWIDWNGDGDFLDANEQIATNIQDNGTGDTNNTTGTINFNVNVPIGAITTANTFARFRWSTTSGLNTTTTASNGEVEDYRVTIIGLDYGDAPDVYGDASHTISASPNIYLGSIEPDSEADTQLGTDAGASAAGDDSDGNDEEDAFNTLPNVPSIGNYSLNIPLNTTSNATLHGWIDFDQNGKFEANEYQSIAVSSSDTTANLTWSIPVGTIPGSSYVRLRLTSDTLFDNSTTTDIDERSVGSASNGEVEDYPVTLEAASIYDYGDAPDTSGATGTGDYQTTSTNGGAAQVVIDEVGQVLSLGNNIDIDSGNLQDTDALADDNDVTPDDEDGVASFPTLTTAEGQTYTVTVTARNNVPAVSAYLVGFIDFNQDGDFEDAGERSNTVEVTSDFDALGTDGELRSFEVTFTTPGGIVAGNTYARFRLGQVQATAESATGAAVSTDNGEVEDYQITIIPPSINGTIFEDVNYGGGAGRDLASSSGVGLANVRVELYDSTGAFLSSQTTNADGFYEFTSGINSGQSYSVRVVNETVTSSRPLNSGFSAANTVAVQTYRYDPDAATPAITNEVGGANPALSDSSANTTNANLSDLTAQSVSSFTLSGSGTVDFGFNFDTIVNTNDSGQGSLRQFINNSNALGGESSLAQAGSRLGIDGSNQTLPAGKESSIFKIPESALNTGVAVITPTTLLPNITDDSTYLDATTQTVNIGNTNATTLGYSGAVGTGSDGRTGTGDEPNLNALAAPEVQLVGQQAFVTGLNITGDDFAVRGMSIYGFGSVGTIANFHGQVVFRGEQDFQAELNAIGVSATSETAPAVIGANGIGTMPPANGTAQSNVTINNNFIANLGNNGVYSTGQVTGAGLPAAELLSNFIISNNVVVSNGDIAYYGGSNGTALADGILLEWCASSCVISENYIDDSHSYGMQLTRNIGLLLQNNTITGSGRGNVNEFAGIGSWNNDLLEVVNNVLADNRGSGILVSRHPGSNRGAEMTRRTRISANSTYNNGNLGIDLFGTTDGSGSGFQDGVAPYVTPNDGVKEATTARANAGMDYPIVTAALNSSGSLTVEGYIGNDPAGSSTFANAELEFFIADDDGNNNGKVFVSDPADVSVPHGEGRTYIGSCSADANSLFNCTFPDAGSLGLTDPTNITATATDDSGNTSEFSAPATLDAPPTATVVCPTEGAGAGSGYASSGSGIYKNDIFWLDWSCGGVSQFNPGDVVQKTWTSFHGIEITAIVSNITRTLEPYNTGNWGGDRLDELYGGVNPIGLSNLNGGEDPSYEITFSMTLNGVSIPADIVTAEAEDTDLLESATWTTDGTPWQPLEVAPNSSLEAEFSNGGQTVTMQDRFDAIDDGGVLIALTENVSTISVEMFASGFEAVAFGIMAPFDFGDADGYPSSGGHLARRTAIGGSQPTTFTPVNSLDMATLVNNSPYLGNIGPDIDPAETSDLATVDADGDDNNTLDDEDGITLPVLSQGDTSYTIETNDIIANTTGVATLHAWIDFNRNSDFEPGEYRSVEVDNGTLAGDLIWSELSGITSGTTYARFRITTDSNIDNTTPYLGAINGEMEDYQIAVAASDPNLILVKRITAINPGRENEIRFNTFVDDGIADNEDNQPNWPDGDDTYLPGVISVSNIQPGDEIEYTIYFLSNGDGDANNVQICDVIPDNMSFVDYGFDNDFGIALLNSSAPGATATNLSNAADTDEGTFYVPGTALPTITVGEPPQTKDLCQKVDSTGATVGVNTGNNINGAVVVELDNVPKADNPGDPVNSYGFIRFRARVQ